MRPLGGTPLADRRGVVGRESIAMSLKERDEEYTRRSDAIVHANRLRIGKKLLERDPELALPMMLPHARSLLRRVLARRGLVTSAEDEARIDACSDLATLERWIVEAVTASEAGEALR